MKTWVYVDGFNLYYGAVKDTPYRWLDLNRMCQLLLPGHQITKIKYFTARVSGRSNDLSQFPAVLTDAQGVFHKPPSW